MPGLEAPLEPEHQSYSHRDSSCRTGEGARMICAYLKFVDHIVGRHSSLEQRCFAMDLVT